MISLGITLSRTKYIDKYIDIAKMQGIDIKTTGFLKNMTINPLSAEEKKKLTEYIINNDDFDSRLFYQACGEETQDELFGALLVHIAENGVTEDIIKILKSNQDYIELIQEEILEELRKNPTEGIDLALYLDFSIDKNMELLVEYNDIIMIYNILKKNIFQEKILHPKDFIISSLLSIIRKENLDDSIWKVIKKEIVEYIATIKNLEENKSVLQFIVDIAYQDREFAESELIDLYKETRLYTDIALEYLAKIKSPYAYREMISFMLTSEARKERVKYAVKLIMKYPENATSIYSYATELKDEKLLLTLDEVASKFKIQYSFSEKYQELKLDTEEQIQIIPHETIISEFLFDLAKEIKAKKFYASVGFTFASGLRMLYPLISYVNSNEGHIELISGSLQNFEDKRKTTKIDKSTVKLLNTFLNELNFSLYSYIESFYHGKYFYLANENKAYVIIGSTNISKTAFLDNYELDVLVTLDTVDKQNQFIYWYDDFRTKCTKIESLNEDDYDELKWESELDIYSAKVIHRMSDTEIRQKINEITDEETQFRLNSWMNHNPAEIYSDLGIASLPDYIVFLYAEKGLAVFESFVPGNAYYTFKYYDFDILLKNVSQLSKTQMIAASEFLNRGYHITNKIKLEQKISNLL